MLVDYCIQKFCAMQWIWKGILISFQYACGEFQTHNVSACNHCFIFFYLLCSLTLALFILLIKAIQIMLCKLRVFHLRLRPKTSVPGKKTPTRAENIQLRQIRENSKFNWNFTFQSGSTIFVLDFNTSHEHFVPCLWQAGVSMRVFSFSPMFDSSLQHK